MQIIGAETFAPQKLAPGEFPAPADDRDASDCGFTNVETTACATTRFLSAHRNAGDLPERLDIPDAAREAVRSVPAGFVATYGDIAAIINVGPRQAGRLVGQIADAAPWWRIVYADGRPSSCHAGTAEHLLRQEGIEFLGQRVNVAVHRITRD